MQKNCERVQDLYETYFDDVYHYLLYLTNSRTEAEDLSQDTFMKVLKCLDSFNHKASIKTWILSIAKRTCIDHFRGKSSLRFYLIH